MNKYAVKLLCEDSRNGSEDYVFAELVVWLLCDQLGCHPWDPAVRRRFKAEARNGATNVRKDCNQSASFRDAIHVVALYDEDKIGRLFGPGCRRQIHQRARAESPYAPQLSVVLLRDNLETILQIICDHATIDPLVRARAIQHKRLNERDIILKRAIGSSATAHDLRKRLGA